MYQFVVLKRLSPDRFDISVFGFGEGDDVGVWVGWGDLPWPVDPGDHVFVCHITW